MVTVVLAGVLLAVVVAVIILAAWVRRFLVFVTLNGLSTTPTHQGGDRVLVRRKTVADLRRGEVAVVQAPNPQTGWRDNLPFDGRVDEHEWGLKRVVALPGDAVPAEVNATSGTTVPATSFAVLDDVMGADSRQFGLVPGHQLLGVVVRRWLRSTAEAGSNPPP